MIYLAKKTYNLFPNLIVGHAPMNFLATLKQKLFLFLCKENILGTCQVEQVGK